MPQEKTMPKGTEAQRLSDVKVGTATTTLIHGGSRSGKTYLIGTCGSRMVYIYFTVGEGIDTLKSPGFTKRYPDCNPIVVPIHETNEVKAFDAVRQTIDFMVDNRRDEFDFIAVDEATAFRRHAMWKGIEISSVEGRSETLTKTQNRKDLPQGFFLPVVQDYGAEMGLMEWWTATYTDDAKESGYHLIVAAHSRYIYEKSGKKISDAEVLTAIKPGFTGKTFPDDITRYFDNVFYMEKVGGGTNVQYRLRIHGDEIITAGTRYGGVFLNNRGSEVSSIDDPNFSDMIRQIQESKK